MLHFVSDSMALEDVVNLQPRLHNYIYLVMTTLALAYTYVCCLIHLSFETISGLYQ